MKKGEVPRKTAKFDDAIGSVRWLAAHHPVVRRAGAPAPGAFATVAQMMLLAHHAVGVTTMVGAPDSAACAEWVSSALEQPPVTPAERCCGQWWSRSAHPGDSVPISIMSGLAKLGITVPETVVL